MYEYSYYVRLINKSQKSSCIRSGLVLLPSEVTSNLGEIFISRASREDILLTFRLFDSILRGRANIESDIYHQPKQCQRPFAKI